MKSIELIPLSCPTTATIAVPGSKSYTNRAFVLGALCDMPVRLVNLLSSDDTEAMVECLRGLGIGVEVSKKELVENYHPRRHLQPISLCAFERVA